MRHVTNGTPVVLGGALVVPIGLLRKLRGETTADATEFAADAAARARIEILAMDAVRRAEEARGCRVVDVSAQKCGWDITSYSPALDGKIAESRHIEVKGSIKGGDHRNRDQERNLRELESGRQIPPRYRPRWRRRLYRWPALCHASLQRRTRLGRVLR